MCYNRTHERERVFANVEIKHGVILRSAATKNLKKGERIMRESTAVIKRRTVAEKLVFDILGIAVIVMAVILAVSIISAVMTDKKEKEAVKNSYYNNLEQSMEEYGRLHTEGGSYASVIYSGAYKNYASVEEAYLDLCPGNEPTLMAVEE